MEPLDYHYAIRIDAMFLNTLYIHGYSANQDVLAVTDFPTSHESYIMPTLIVAFSACYGCPIE